jgi:inorganic pyrophosphatase
MRIYGLGNTFIWAIDNKDRNWKVIKNEDGDLVLMRMISIELLHEVLPPEIEQVFLSEVSLQYLYEQVYGVNESLNKINEELRLKFFKPEGE